MTQRFPEHPHVTYKTPLIQERTQFLCDCATEVLYEMGEYCEERKLPLVITDSVSTPAEDVQLKRVSDEHAQGRAFDISLHEWNDLEVRAFIDHFEKRFLSVAAVGKKSGMPRLIFRHVGTADHLHVQVARIYGLKDPLNLTVV
jgi:hypothetical protein